MEARDWLKQNRKEGVCTYKVKMKSAAWLRYRKYITFKSIKVIGVCIGLNECDNV